MRRPSHDEGQGPPPVLHAEGLLVRYGRIVAVQDVGLSVAEGQVVALLGPNGAGKTSLLSAVAGLVPATGTVQLDGEDINGQPAHRLAARGLRMVPESRALFPDMTVAENLAVGAHDGRLAPLELERVTTIFPVLGDRRGQRAGTLSGGEQQQLAIGRALIGHPRVLLLDEPSMGLAPKIVSSIMTVLADLTGSGLSVLLAEQNAHAVWDSVDTAILMERGRAVTVGTPAALRPRLEQGYLAGGNR